VGLAAVVTLWLCLPQPQLQARVLFSYATYKRTLTTDAGAKLLSVDVAAAAGKGIAHGADSVQRGREIAISAAALGSEAKVLEAVHGLLQQVDILIDESYTPDGASLVRCRTLLSAFGGTWAALWQS
jgi:urease gamma subunit